MFAAARDASVLFESGRPVEVLESVDAGGAACGEVGEPQMLQSPDREPSEINLASAAQAG